MPGLMCEGSGGGMQWFHCLCYKCVVQTCMGFDFIFIHTGTCFPFPCHVPPAFISKDAMSSDLSPSPIKPCCYPLLVSTNKILLQARLRDWKVNRCGKRRKGRKSCCRPPLLTSNCQKFCKIHKCCLVTKGR